MPNSDLTILICTHDRVDLLERALASLNSALRPEGCAVRVLVAANACTDGTHDFLEAYQQHYAEQNWLPLDWFPEPVPGKSNALNSAIPRLASGLVAFVDDDHRVDPNYLVGVCRDAREHPDATLFCGRILPDWDGTEPAWVHDTGPYRIYPLPVPRYDQGDMPRMIGEEGPLPGGGNLFLRCEVFQRVGQFSPDLGPSGHDLGGGEDIEFVLRALRAGERLRYAPDVLQYHYVDTDRLRISYLIRKSFQRSRASVQVRHDGTSVPRYLWRKIAGYAGSALFSLSWPRTRFYLVRTAAALGEMQGIRTNVRLRREEGQGELPGIAPVATAVGVAVGAAIARLPADVLWQGLLVATVTAAVFTLFLLGKSLLDFSRTGPQLRQEIQRHYLWYSLYGVGRLGVWAFILSGLMAASGVSIYAMLAGLSGHRFSVPLAAGAAVSGILAITLLQFCRHLIFLPATIAASSHYRLSRFYPLWERLSPGRLRWAERAVLFLAVATTAAVVAQLVYAKAWLDLLELGVWVMFVTWMISGVLSPRNVRPVASKESVPPEGKRPNIVMIGSDTLRADRIGRVRNGRSLTPHLDALVQRGVHFSNCYVPCARTAPSLLSLLTGTWPHTHGIRDNFAADEETSIGVPGFPAMLAQAGYRTAAVGDWAAGDLGKFPLGFQQTDLPDDQWNIRYLIRQGPKDLRLFLSLFTHNRFGKWFLPEIYYLAGIPLTREVGRDACATISTFATDGQPFFLNVFMAATHPPFGSEYPYYTLYSDPAYRGESKFLMARLTDPFEIIRRQGEPRHEFDLDQIISLYDGCVRSFDDEVARILDHIQACGLADNTIVVVYSDHGMEFFEHDTWGQGNSVRGDFSPKVPLILFDPRRPEGRVVPDIVRAVDLVPTLLDLLQLECPPHLEGKSLRPYLEQADAELALPAYAETGIWLTDVPGMPENHLRYPNLLELLEIPDKESGTLAIKAQYKGIIVRAKDRMVRRGRWKLVYQPLEEGCRLQLFDVEADPECRNDVSAQHPVELQDLRTLLRSWMEKDGQLTSLPPLDPSSPVQPKMASPSLPQA